MPGELVADAYFEILRTSLLKVLRMTIDFLGEKKDSQERLSHMDI
jgi:hypothetical protein